MIYLDNAATSWPKPPEVLKAMVEVLEHSGGNPGRSGHTLSIRAARIMYQTREDISDFFHGTDPLRTIFANNITHAINTVLNGILSPGDRVVTTSIEHNAVMRPLRYLESRGVELDIISCYSDGTLDLDEAARKITPATKLVVATHASNVLGTVVPVAQIGALTKQSGSMFMVDTAQTAGVLPIDITAMGIDFLAFTGHKGLLGPPGIGGLILGSGVDASRVLPLIRGGTGSQSEIEEQPEFLPDKFESGTPNLVGIAGLQAGIKWLVRTGLAAVREHEQALTGMLIEGLSSIQGIEIYGTRDKTRSIGVLSFVVPNMRVSDIGLKLDDEFGICARVGLHCAPAAHRTAGSFPEGTVRLAPGIFTSTDDVKTTIAALEKIVRV